MGRFEAGLRQVSAGRAKTYRLMQFYKSESRDLPIFAEIQGSRRSTLIKVQIRRYNVLTETNLRICTLISVDLREPYASMCLVF